MTRQSLYHWSVRDRTSGTAAGRTAGEGEMGCLPRISNDLHVRRSRLAIEVHDARIDAFRAVLLSGLDEPVGGVSICRRERAFRARPKIAPAQDGVTNFPGTAPRMYPRRDEFHRRASLRRCPSGPRALGPSTGI